MPPALPAPPDFTACPPGWRSVTDDDDGIASCNPWPETGRASCALGEAHFPGEPGCVPIGDPCPAGDFAAAPAGATVLYVREGATGGDGTMASPFGAIGDAIEVATIGTTILLSRGTWDEDLVLGDGITLRGACVAETTLVSSRAPDANWGVVRSVGAGVRVENLRIGPSQRPAFFAGAAGQEIAVEAVVVDAPSAAAAYATDGGRIVATDVVIRDVASNASRRLGRAFTIENGASAEVRRVAIDRVRETAIFAADGATVVVEDTVIAGVAPQEDDDLFGFGVSVLAASATLRNVVISEAHEAAVRVMEVGSALDVDHLVATDIRGAAVDGYGGFAVAVETAGTATVRHLLGDRASAGAIYVYGEGTTATFEDVVLRDTRPREADLTLGTGISLELAARLVVRRAVVLRSRGAGVSVLGGATLEAEDLRVADTTSEASEGHFGRGLDIGGGSHLVARRLLVERNQESGIFLFGDDVTLGMPVTTMDLEDIIVRDTRPQEADGFFGRGFSVQDEGTVRLVRASIEGAHDCGLMLNGAGGRIDGEDVVVRGTRPRPDGRYGRGVNVQFGGALSLRRFVVEDNPDVGIIALDEGTVVTLEDLRVSRTSPNAMGEFGRGINVEIGAELSVTRGLVEDSVDVGVAAFADAVVTLDEVEVRRTRAQNDLGGTGIGGFEDARITAHQFAVSDSELCGVQLARGAMIDLSDGTVTRNVIGACVQVAGYDLSRLMSGVVYRDNGVALDSTTLPIPGVGGGLDPNPAAP